MSSGSSCAAGDGQGQRADQHRQILPDDAGIRFIALGVIPGSR